MQVEVRDVGPCRKGLKITIPSSRVKEALETNLQEASRHVRLPGFRAGRAPRQLIEKRFGKALLRDVKENLVAWSFREAIEKEGIEPIRDPEVDLEGIDLVPEKDLLWEVEIEVKPLFDLPEYKGIRASRPRPRVGEIEIDQAIEQLRRDRGTLETVEGPAEGDEDLLRAKVRIESQGQVVVAGLDRLIPVQSGDVLGLPVQGLADRLRGGKAGDRIEAEATLPSSFSNEALRGKPAAITLEIEKVERPVLPAADDALAQALDFENLEELRRDLERRIRVQKEGEADAILEKRILDQLLEKAPFEVPPSLVENRVRNELRPLAHRMARQDMPDEEREARLAQMEEKIRGEATWAARAALLLERIAGAEKVFVTEDEVEAYLREAAGRSGRSLEETRRLYEEEGLLSHVRGTLRDRKTRARLRELAHVEVEG